MWIRVPRRNEKCSRTGLGPYLFYQILKDAGSAIRSARLGSGKKCGARLVYWPDMHAFLLKVAEQQTGPAGIAPVGKESP